MSSRLKGYLSKKEDAFRKIISRLKHPINKLEDISFPNNEYFLYLNDFHHDKRARENLISSFNDTNSIYRIAINYLISNHGINNEKFHIISGAPIQKRKHKIQSNKILKDLLSIGIFKMSDDQNYVLLDRGSKDEEVNLNLIKLQDTFNMTMQNIVFDWFRETFSSYNKIKQFDKTNHPEFGGYQWNIVTPCYLQPFVRYKKEGFVLIDVFSRTLTINEFQGFAAKIESLKSIKKGSPFLPVLVSEWFDTGVFESCKKKGILPLTFDKICGKESAKLFIKLRHNLNNFFISKMPSNDSKAEILSGLNTLLNDNIGNYNNIKGTLFHFLITILISAKERNKPFIGKKFNSNGKLEAEADIIIENLDCVRVIECKGYNLKNKIELAEVKGWFERKIPSIKKYYDSRDNGSKRLIFESWSISEFSKEAQAYIEEKNSHTKAYDIIIYNKDKIISYSTSIKELEIAKALKEYFN